MIILLIGQPGSGKTTLGKILSKKFNLKHLDGDLNREGDSNFDYTKPGRDKNIKSILSKSKYGDQGKVISLVCPYNELRKKFFELKGPVYGFYLFTEDIRGREHYFCEGFEQPSNEFIKIDTSKTVEYCIDQIEKKIKDKNSTYG